MTSRLADDISLSIGGVPPVRLRASLRAIVRLERQHGFHALARGINDRNLSIMTAIVVESAVDDPTAILEAIAYESLGLVLPALTAATFQILEQILEPADDEDTGNASQASSSTAPTTLSSGFEKLFSIATGALGWSPEAAYSATPAEILLAWKGRKDLLNDLLQAVFGTGKDDQPAEYDPNPPYQREKYLALQDLGRIR